MILHLIEQATIIRFCHIYIVLQEYRAFDIRQLKFLFDFLMRIFSELNAVFPVDVQSLPVARLSRTPLCAKCYCPPSISLLLSVCLFLVYCHACALRIHTSIIFNQIAILARRSTRSTVRYDTV